MPSGKDYERNDEDLKIVLEYSAVGIPQEDIALVIGICKNTLRKHYEKELRIGAIKANAEVGGRLFQMTKTVPAAAIFWSKTRLHMRETGPIIDEEAADRPLVFNRGEARPSQITDDSDKKNGTEE